ncbi:MAG: TetR/AcrR family transcriptional regulator [Deltaproteobacteria bacterium]|nr:TetR/AcrR family transcriptional regulator [Deltaproteobacteria bacterium]
MVRVAKQARAQRTVAEILAAARNLLLEEGPSAFNTNRIAKDAGVSVGTLYEYFEDKQSIAQALTDELAAEEGRLVLDRLGNIQGGLAQIAETVVALVFQLYRKNLSLYRMLWALTAEPRRSNRRPAEQAIIERAAAYLAPHIQKKQLGDVRLVATTAFNLVEGLCARMVEECLDDFAEADCREQVVAAVLGYLRVPRRKSRG